MLRTDAWGERLGKQDEQAAYAHLRSSPRRFLLTLRKSPQGQFCPLHLPAAQKSTECTCELEVYLENTGHALGHQDSCRASLVDTLRASLESCQGATTGVVLRVCRLNEELLKTLQSTAGGGSG